MTAYTGLVIDGVMRHEHGEGVIQQGHALYQLLKETGRLALITLDDLDRTKYWLETNGYTEHVYLIGPDPTDAGLPVPQQRLRQLRRLQRTAAGMMSFYVEPDPETAAAAFAEGMTALLFLHPRYQRPSFRPDYEGAIRPWDVLTAEVERQRSLKARDVRPHSEVL